LKELVADLRWKTAVERSSLCGHYLSVMPYEAFCSSEFSRVLSYRWNNKITVDCTVIDPAGKLSTIKGDISLGFLTVPLTGWQLLWVDALNHLNDGDGIACSVKTMGNLYLRSTTLPLYFMNNDFIGQEEAINRGWMHQELAFGAIDRAAVTAFIDLCAHQLNGRPYRGNPYYNPSGIALLRFISKRAKVNKYRSDDCFGRLWTWWHSAKDINSPTAQRDEAQKQLDLFIDDVSKKQLSDEISENVLLLQEDRIFCWSILLSVCNTNLWDKSDAYFAAISVVGAACGMPVSDPLAAYKASNISNLPKNSDGTLYYSVEDLDLTVLNQNNEILRKCWRTILSPEKRPPVDTGKSYTSTNDGRTMPYGLRNDSVVTKEAVRRVDLTLIPPGMHTLGLGPIEISTIGTDSLASLASDKRTARKYGRTSPQPETNLENIFFSLIRSDDCLSVKPVYNDESFSSSDLDKIKLFSLDDFKNPALLQVLKADGNNRF
jgi:hypothetical protein